MAESRVRWNNEEKALLAKQAQEVMRAKGLSPLQALREAQSVLPPGRRRTLRHMGEAPWLARGAPRPAAAARGAGEAPAMSAAATGGGGMREALVDFFAGVVREAFERAIPGAGMGAAAASDRGAPRKTRSAPAAKGRKRGRKRAAKAAKSAKGAKGAKSA